MRPCRREPKLGQAGGVRSANHQETHLATVVSVTHWVRWIFVSEVDSRSPRTTGRRRSTEPTVRASDNRREGKLSWRSGTACPGPRTDLRRRCPAPGWWRWRASRARRNRRRTPGTPKTWRTTPRQTYSVEPLSEHKHTLP